MPKAIPQVGKPKEKSVKLLPSEVEFLQELRKTANSHLALARQLRIDRVSLQRIMEKGSGSENNVYYLRRKLSKLKKSA